MGVMSIDIAPEAPPQAAPQLAPEVAREMALDAVPDLVPDVLAEVLPDRLPEGAPEAEPGAQAEAGPGPVGGWSVEQRGSFVLGRCGACGFTTAARRARFSMETDMLRHGAECGETQESLTPPVVAVTASDDRR